MRWVLVTAASQNVTNVNVPSSCANRTVYALSEGLPCSANLNELGLPKLIESFKQLAMQFFRELDEQCRMRKTPWGERRLATRALTDGFAKPWFSSVHHELDSSQIFKSTEVMWGQRRQSQIYCATHYNKSHRTDRSFTTTILWRTLWQQLSPPVFL
jgi:hypothetical protein